MNYFLKVPKKQIFSKIKEKFKFLLNFSPNALLDKHEKRIQKEVDSILWDDTNQGYLTEISSQTHKIIAFNNYRGISKIDVKTDADLLGGETTYELRYNMPDESLIIEGDFEMKRKDLIPNGVMFVRLQFQIVKKSYRFNLVKIRARTNGHFLKIQLGICFNMIETVLFAGHIVERSNEFETYALPFKNFKSMIDTESDDYLNSPTGIIDTKLNVLMVEIESKQDGPYHVELHSIELCYDEKYDEIYQKYQIPIFKKL